MKAHSLGESARMWRRRNAIASFRWSKVPTGGVIVPKQREGIVLGHLNQKFGYMKVLSLPTDHSLYFIGVMIVQLEFVFFVK